MLLTKRGTQVHAVIVSKELLEALGSRVKTEDRKAEGAVWVQLPKYLPHSWEVIDFDHRDRIIQMVQVKYFQQLMRIILELSSVAAFNFRLSHFLISCEDPSRV